MGLMNKSGFLALILAISAFFAVSAQAFIGTRPLSADKAFAVSVVVDDANKITAHWQIANGYYLYREKIEFTFDPKVTTNIILPPGEVKQDLNHGEYQVYSGNVDTPILLQTPAKKLQLTINYQGCSDKGFCYPPMQKSLTLDLPTATSPVNNPSVNLDNLSFQSLLTDQNSIRNILGSQNMFVMLIIFAGLGLLLAFTPCILPMIPILTSIIVGHKQPVTTKKAFLLSSTYVMGASLTYAAAGMIAATMGSSLQTSLQQPWIIAIVSGMFVLLALSLFGIYDLRLPQAFQTRITSISRKQQGGTFVGVFIMGMVSTLIVSPCVTAPLVGVLMYIAQTGNVALGGGALFFLGLGMGIPLIALGMSAGKWLPRRGPWMTGVQYIFGVMMLIMAYWLLSRVASVTTLMTFSAVLFFGAALYFAFYKPYHHGRILLNRSLGVVMGVAGILVLVAMNTSFKTNVHTNASAPSFTIVHNVDELNQQLSLAKAAKKPVLLDFYADWCASCIVMDKKVFSLPQVIHGLNQFVLLRVDLSENNEADELLLKSFDVVAPPSVLFFNNYGNEVTSRRIVGVLDADEFITRINTFITACSDKNASC
jgi:thiol:disulfide interchange protein DsbD